MTRLDEIRQLTRLDHSQFFPFDALETAQGKLVTTFHLDIGLHGFQQVKPGNGFTELGG